LRSFFFLFLSLLLCGFSLGGWFYSFIHSFVRVLCRHDQVLLNFSSSLFIGISIRLLSRAPATVKLIFSLFLPACILFFFFFPSQSPIMLPAFFQIVPAYKQIYIPIFFSLMDSLFFTTHLSSLCRQLFQFFYIDALFLSFFVADLMNVADSIS